MGRFIRLDDYSNSNINRNQTLIEIPNLMVTFNLKYNSNVKVCLTGRVNQQSTYNLWLYFFYDGIL